jgi:prepilin-type N-terminal cleavage/methylation domain-containing protein
MNTKNRAFTIVELLVVIAIIGILSSAVLNSVTNARVKARIGAATATLKSLGSALALCVDEDVPIDLPTADTQDGGAGPVCAGSDSNWGLLPGTWTYTGASDQVTGDTFTIVAAGETPAVTCTLTELGFQGCV